MPVIESPPRELLRVTYQAGVISFTSLAAHGAALSTPWGGTFTIANRPNVDIQLSAYFVSNSGAGDTTLHVLVDGTCILEDAVKLGSTSGRRIESRTTVTGLAAGAHTIAVQGSVASGTGFISSGAPPIRGLLTVREVG